MTTVETVIETREDQRRALTLEAMADVDARRVVDHRDVVAWAANLTASREQATG